MKSTRTKISSTFAKVILGSALILGIGCTASANTGSENINIHKMIKNELRLPDHLKKEVNKIQSTVYFQVDNEGKITSLQVETSHPELKAYITEKFSKLDFGHLGLETEKTYFLNIAHNVI